MNNYYSVYKEKDMRASAACKCTSCKGVPMKSTWHCSSKCFVNNIAYALGQMAKGDVIVEYSYSDFMFRGKQLSRRFNYKDRDKIYN